MKNIILAFIFFITMGSFLNVCIYRVPKKQSVTLPPSHCVHCSHPLAFYDLIPILSFILLKGTCRHCSKKISKQYIIIEIMTGILLLILYCKYGLSLIFFKYMMFTALLIVISVVDYLELIICNEFIALGVAIGTLFLFASPFTVKMLVSHATGFLCTGVFFLIISFITKGKMGGGDIKLAAVLGLWFGILTSFAIILSSFILCAVVSLILIAFKIKNIKDIIPFGPFLSVSAYIFMLYGKQILDWYSKYAFLSL